MRLRTNILATTLMLSFAACVDGVTPADQADAAVTQQQMKEMRSQVGLPALTQFTEARQAKMVAELRDQAIKTYTYTIDMNGNRHLLCESVGFGLPYSVQITNPQTLVTHSYGNTSMPQPEPNGLFMPESADATWVMCSDGRGGVAPVYSEPLLLVSPFPLGHVDAAQNSGFNDQVQIQKLPPSTNTPR